VLYHGNDGKRWLTSSRARAGRLFMVFRNAEKKSGRNVYALDGTEWDGGCERVRMFFFDADRWHADYSDSPASYCQLADELTRRPSEFEPGHRITWSTFFGRVGSGHGSVCQTREFDPVWGLTAVFLVSLFAANEWFIFVKLTLICTNKLWDLFFPTSLTVSAG